MANKTVLMVGAAVGIGALWYATKDATPATTLEDNQAKSYTQISGDGGSGDNREESIDNVSKFLGEVEILLILV
mgnify:CR=1 FL=1